MALVTKFRDSQGAYLRETGVTRRLNGERFHIGRSWTMDPKQACNFLGDADRQMHHTFSEEEIQSLGIVAVTSEMSLRLDPLAQTLLNEMEAEAA